MQNFNKFGRVVSELSAKREIGAQVNDRAQIDDQNLITLMGPETQPETQSTSCVNADFK